jgi:hypothetical protein
MKINWTKFYWPVFAAPLLLMFMGVCSNQLVLISNGGKFPVMVNEKQRIEHQQSTEVDIGDLHVVVPVAEKQESQFLGDDVHSIMGKNSHLKALADIFNIGEGVASIGDFLILAGEKMWAFAPVIWLTLITRKLWDLT